MNRERIAAYAQIMIITVAGMRMVVFWLLCRLTQRQSLIEGA